MKIKKITRRSVKPEDKVYLTEIGDGFIQGSSGSLPDVDNDFQSDRRADVKEYFEKRYNHDGKERVFSAGTIGTMQLKAVIRDVCDLYGVPKFLSATVSKFIPKTVSSWSDFMKHAFNEKNTKNGARKLYSNFVRDYPEVVRDIKNLVAQPKSHGIHPSALIITPEKRDGVDMECFDFLPIRRVSGILTSELDGSEIDDIGLLKNDVLSTIELTKIGEFFKLIEKHHGVKFTVEDFAESELDDEATFKILCDGKTKGVFQFASDGMTAFMKNMQPSRFEDFIAGTSLFRPAALASGSASTYNECKSGDMAAVYAWGTHDILGETYGVLAYQEQLAQMAREIGGFSIAEGVRLVKLISKKNTEKIHAMQGKFMEGALAKGCPKEDAEKIWEMIESGGSYLFNKCISGDEMIYRTHGGKWQPTVAEMYKIKNDIEYAKKTKHTALRSKYNTRGYGYGYSLNEEGRLIKNAIKDIRFEGIKPIYRITLESGETLDVTSNHKHPTQRGMVLTDQLIAGEDSMFVNIGHVRQDTVYRFTDSGTNNPDYHSSEDMVPYILNSESGTEGFTKSSSSSERARLVYYKNNLKGSSCEKCGATDCRLEVHHIDGNHAFTGENHENLETLCVSCHKKEHYKLGRTKQGERGLYTKSSVVVSVEFLKNDEVYDVEMDSPYHTFATANGVVTCNSHATSYSVISYIGAYVKAHYPTIFYTVALELAKKDDVQDLLIEIGDADSGVRITAPSINVSGFSFSADFDTGNIYWSLSRISQCGVATTNKIVRDREIMGKFESLEDFLIRGTMKKYLDRQVFEWARTKDEFVIDGLVFDNGMAARKHFENHPYSKLYELVIEKDLTEEQKNYLDEMNDGDSNSFANLEVVRNMIFSGCFDEIEGVKAVTDRYGIMKRAYEFIGESMDAKHLPPTMLNKHYFWSAKQIEISGIGAVDYNRVYRNSEVARRMKGKGSYLSLDEMSLPENDGKRAVFCATISDIEYKSYPDKKTGEIKDYIKLSFMQNKSEMVMTVWSDATLRFKDLLTQDNLGKILIGNCAIKFNDWTKKNELQSQYSTEFFIVE